MSLFKRTFVKNEVPRRTGSDGLTAIYCKSCTREIIKQLNPQIRSVTKCQICLLKEQGVENAEDYVLAQYYSPTDPNRMPTPIDFDHSLEGGILVLNPDEKEIAESGNIPQSGGVYGTVRSLFKAIGFNQQPKEVPVSKEIAVKRRKTGGLYDERIK